MLPPAGFIIITALSGSYANNPHKEVGIALIPFLYLFFMCYNAGWIVNGALYTTEILPYSIRSKALAVYVFFQTAAICVSVKCGVWRVGCGVCGAVCQNGCEQQF